MLSEQKTEFHKPGTLSTWFRNLFGPPPPAPPVIPDLAQRRALLKQRDRELAQWDAERVSHERRVEEARARAAEARLRLQDAEAVLGEVEAARLGASLDHDARVRRLEAQVRAGASPHIETFLRDVGDQLQALREGGVGVHESWSRPNPVDGRREHRVSSNLASIEARRLALMAALAAGEAMQLEPLEEEAVVARLTALRDGVPAAEPLYVEGVDPLTPAERRALGWHLAEQEARR